MRFAFSAPLSLLSRVFVALVGGYATAAAYAAAMARWLPMDRTDAVTTGMIASFAIYAAIAVMAFAVRSAARAWIWLGVCGLPPALALYLSMRGGAA
ncbi:DUF3649 domain-containing protein [Luteibacter sp. PPL201]|uniref:DUF3649 domain-containing protein n=1 Tax=Luteibacter sahnii TaxID=3021977 RepID=A0ABT6BDB2_9GAMM